MNLDQAQQTHQTPSNMMFQQMQQQQHQNMQNQQQQLPDPSLRKLPSTKLDPYKILGISKQYDESMLKKAYLKKAMKAHPDRGGSKDEFQKVSIAYTVLKKKLKEKQQIHSHHELRDNAKSFMGSQPTQQISTGDNFDVKVFNKIYDENRIEDAYDDGYGSWMKESSNDNGQQKMFQGEFNKDMFNHEFEKYKQEQKQKMGTQITQYQEPQVRLSMKNQDSLVTLGQGKVSNFSGEVGNLGFTDYKAAFTVDSTLIDTSSVDINGRANSIKGVERERSNISYQLSPEDQQRVAYQEALQQKEERARIQRLQVYDQRSEDTYNKVHQLLLR
jgi:curved DNA-binding protein CbpA